MAERHTIAVIAGHIIEAARPLSESCRSLGGFKRMMGRLGFQPTALPPAFAQLAVDVDAALASLAAFPADPSILDAFNLLASAAKIFTTMGNLANAPPPPGVPAVAFKGEFQSGLFALLFNDYLSRSHPGSLRVLTLLGASGQTIVPPSGGRPAFTKLDLKLGNLVSAISQPGELPKIVFGWGTPNLRVGDLVDELAQFFLGLDFPVSIRTLDTDEASTLLAIPASDLAIVPEHFVLPFLHARVGGQMVQVAVALHGLPPSGGLLPGVMLELRIPANFPAAFTIHPKAKMRLRAATTVAERIGIVLRPGHVSVQNLLAPATPPTGGVGIGFDFTTGPTTLFGNPKSTRLEFAGASIDLGADFSNGAWSVVFANQLNGLKFVLDPGDGDSFIKQILGIGKSSIDLPLGLEWTKEHGIRFKGSAALEVALHPHLQLGPVRVDDMSVKLSAPSRVQLEIGAGISGELGPLTFMIQGIGLRSEVTFANGNAGPFGISLGFLPPKGVGLELDAGGFKGGGFLKLDPDKGEYEGGLDLTFLEVISVRAIGILSTRMPDGRDGFSLLIIIVTEFPPIQLSFGFTLVGVGGLLGLNRTVLLDQLQLGVHDGSLNSILFPTDIVANATRIIGDLKRVFPPQDGHFLIGPMAKLGWGTPTLISLSLGVILDIPRPMFAIIGVLHMALPADELPILHLQVSFAGSVDFESGQLQFDASLFDSRVMTFTLSGDMAVRVYWKHNANFLLSVGGFHPAYTPPPMNLPEMARLGFVMFQGNPHISAQVYFAVTSNSVQFGARVEAYYGIELFNVYGFLGIDVLINFDPFHFVADLTAELGVRTGSTVLMSIQLQLTLEGPTPWHARGTGSFRVGFIVKVTISVSFDVTFGDSRETKLPPVDVLAEVVAALTNLGNWRPRLPSGTNQHVTLRELPDPSKTLVLHPFGALEITQKLVPLHIAIQRFGSRAPDAGSVFTLADVKLGGEDAGVANTREQFAPAQFFTMSDAEKLSRASFADYDAGIVIGGDLAPRSDFMRVRDVVYELKYLPEHHPFILLVTVALEFAGAMVKGSAVAQSVVSQAQGSVSVLEEKTSFEAEQYAVVSTNDLTLHEPHLVFDNATAADQAVQSLVRERPELFGAIQVLPASAIATRAA